MKILVTNDDGIMAEGLAVLTAWIREQGHQTVVVAPKSNYSGQSGAITLGKPLTVTERKPSHWAVGGTPADCVRIALAFLGYHPDLVISGVNHGYNLGQDVYASGTIGAARMAAIRGIPAVALSADTHDWTHVAALLRRHGQTIMEEARRSGPSTVISVNFPAAGGENLVAADLSGPRYDDQLVWAEFDGEHHIVGLDFIERAVDSMDAGTDADAIAEHLTTLTYLPLVPASASARYVAKAQ